MIPQTAEYALRAAVWLAHHPDRPQPSEAMALVTRIPRRYLHKVLQALVRAGLVMSRPGPGGGYLLKRPPQRCTVLEIVNAVAPLPRITRCPLGMEGHQRLCPLHRHLDQAYALIEEAFARVSLADLAGSPQMSPLCSVDTSQTKRRRPSSRRSRRAT
jgi:Rrf2 family nitric oxide-sensitive transcriptional repressor